MGANHLPHPLARNGMSPQQGIAMLERYVAAVRRRRRNGNPPFHGPPIGHLWGDMVVHHSDWQAL